MNFDYIVVQAGGKGSRMKHLTQNKPKALVPVDNLPMIFHLFRKFPDKKFIVIGDYKFDVLKKYLEAFADVEYEIVNAHGKTGTCSGLSSAMAHLPENQAFMLIWCDLVLNKDLDLSLYTDGNYCGISKGFECRWKYENGVFEEQPSSECGVAGLFVFQDKSVLSQVPESGEFVRWLSTQSVAFDTIPLHRTREFGLVSEYNKLKPEKCRPFNKLTVGEDYIIKEAVDQQGEALAKREIAWYEKAKEFGFTGLPKIYSTSPLKMEKIQGKNLYEYKDLDVQSKKEVLTKIVQCLRELHGFGTAPFDEASYNDAYLDKTFVRLEKVRELVPFAKDPYIEINGKKCRNVFYHKEELERLFEGMKPEQFVFLHGDCTFSNMMLKEDLTPVFIDPRGYFGHTQFYGDPAYDWAKLYYSIVGNYDQFNLKRFSLLINESNVNLSVESSGWEQTEEHFFNLLNGEVSVKQIKLIHAIIWLSLTTYAWEDYDSICGAFYNGLLYLEDVL